MNSNTEIKIVQDKAFETIQSAVNKMVNFIKPTFGPASNKVIISTQLNHEVVDDGQRIAAQFELPDPSENAIVKEIRQVSSKTDDRAGDGTTGSLIILQAIINEVAKKTRRNGRQIEKELKKGLVEVKEQLLKSAKQIKTKEDLKKVALTSFDNDKIAEMIADLYFKLGKDGIVEISKSQGLETYVEMSDGIKIDKGYISPYMVTNGERMECIFENPYILLTDYRLTEVADLMPIMDKMAAAGKNNLVIIAENIELHALALLVANLPQVYNPIRKGAGFFSVAVNAPFTAGPGRQNWLEDVALLTGAKVFSSAKGDKLELAEIKDLGRAERFISRYKESVVINPKGNKTERAMAVASLRSAIETEKDKDKKHELTRRLGLFTNGIAVINVGAFTESEQKSLMRKIEDAVASVKSAYKSGVVCGAGFALSRLETSSPILNEALKYPRRQLAENMGMEWTNDFKPNEAFNLVTNKQGHFMDIGVMDSVEVLLAGVESSVSIASNLLTTSGIYTEVPKKPPIENYQN